MLYVIRMTNKVTGEKQINLMGMVGNGKEETADFKNNIEVYMGHKNRLNWGYGKGVFTYVAYTEAEELEAQAWVSGLTVEEVIARREELNAGLLF